MSIEKNIRPLHDQILVRRDPEDTVTKGGILIPEVANNPKLPRGRGVVLAVGPGRKHPKTGARVPIDVKIGDRVVFNKLCGDKVRDDLGMQEVTADLVLVDEGEIIAILEDGSEWFDLPSDVVMTNGGVRCDMAVGACTCGAMHTPEENRPRAATRALEVE